MTRPPPPDGPLGDQLRIRVGAQRRSAVDHQATITVTVRSWDDQCIAEADAQHAVARATYLTELAGDLTGSSTAALLLSYLGGDPADPQSLEGPYLGYELLTGTLGGRTGTFVLALRGRHTGGGARTECDVVPGGGTGELVGITGADSFVADAMTYTMTLEHAMGE